MNYIYDNKNVSSKNNIEIYLDNHNKKLTKQIYNIDSDSYKLSDELDELDNSNDLSIDTSNDLSNDFSNNSSNDFVISNSKSKLLEKELDSECEIKPLPQNYGTKWSDEDKTKLLKLLHKYNKENNDSKDKNIISDPKSLTIYNCIGKIASKLKRSNGGVEAEIKKIIFEKYLEGNSPEKISSELNLVYKNVKYILKQKIDTEYDFQVRNLEKENKILRLKIDNIKLKKELESLCK